MGLGSKEKPPVGEGGWPVDGLCQLWYLWACVPQRHHIMGSELKLWATESLKEVNIWPPVCQLAVNAPTPPYHIPIGGYGHIKTTRTVPFLWNQQHGLI